MSGRVVRLPQWLAAAGISAVVVVVGWAVRMETRVTSLSERLQDAREDSALAVQQSEMEQAYLYNLRVWLSDHGVKGVPEPQENIILKRHGAGKRERE